VEDDFFGQGRASTPWTPPAAAPVRATTSRTRATSTSFGFVGRCLITFLVLLPFMGMVVLAIATGGLSALDPFQIGPTIVLGGAATWIIRDTWKPARRVVKR
jgi:hypothetical protein